MVRGISMDFPPVGTFSILHLLVLFSTLSSPWNFHISITMPKDMTATRSRPVSCRFCRTRKLRCSRTAPCTNCVSRGITCELEDEVTKAAVNPNTVSEAEILARLQRLESLVLSQGFGQHDTMAYSSDLRTPESVDSQSQRTESRIPSPIRDVRPKILDLAEDVAFLDSLCMDPNLPVSLLAFLV